MAACSFALGTVCLPVTFDEMASRRLSPVTIVAAEATLRYLGKGPRFDPPDPSVPPLIWLDGAVRIALWTLTVTGMSTHSSHGDSWLVDRIARVQKHIGSPWASAYFFSTQRSALSSRLSTFLLAGDSGSGPNLKLQLALLKIAP